MRKILMVCLGNICRSPLAEGILKSKLATEGFHIESAGTSNYHEGELPDQRSIDVAAKHGLDITDQKSRPFSQDDFDKYDLIFVMDTSNYQDILKMARDENDEGKVELILNKIYPGENRDVPDPYHDSINGFENVYQMLDESCTVIAKELEN
ncbi:low molecular weight protein-tyrosine-phosphatase [Psychroflexus aestuariivivens]|uniref:low molecular weight protein-tyrosine-phosphatase n=1 Tax=Psychroflexus aestuariivivens TaxID=1795040 RepID=UPI000FD7AA2B|nr:low molecular weight protein-tyrosine-phosphatase [Psychroflexus aestuariivivens]